MNQDIKIILPQGELDIDTQIGFGVTYSVDDIRDISKKNSNFTKTVTLPGSKNNNILMGGLFDINADFTYFNPNFKTPAKIVVDSTTILDGYLQLKNIKKLAVADFAGNYIQYEVVLFDDSIDFITEIGDKLLTDLNFSGYNHTYNKPNIEASWTNTYTDVYTYPLLYKASDVYATSDFKPGIYHRAYLEKIFEANGYTFGGSFFDNETYKKEVIPFNGQTVSLPETEFTRRNFRAGMTGNTPTLSTTSYKGGIINNVVLNPTIQTSLSAYTYLNDDSTGSNFDNDNHFDTLTSTYIVDRNGSYNLDGILNFKVKFESKIEFTGLTSGTTMSRIKITYPNHNYEAGTAVIITGSTGYDGTYSIAAVTTNTIEIAKPFSGTSTGTLAVTSYQVGFGVAGSNQYNNPIYNRNSFNGGTYSVVVTMFKNGVLQQTFNSPQLGGTGSTFPYTSAFNSTFNTANDWEVEGNHRVNILRPNIPLLSGDVITLKYNIVKVQGSENNSNKVMYVDGTTFSTAKSVPLRIKLESVTGATNDAFFSSTAQHSEMTDGDTIYLNDFIAQKIKQIDILNDVTKRYNLYVTSDPNDDKKIILDSRDDFYSASTQTLDWTLLKDFSVEDKIELLSELQNKEVLFTYKADGDDWNKNYTSATSGDSKGQIFGQKKVEFDNEFAKGEKKIESIFSPTPNAYNSVNQRFVIPTIPAVNPKTNVRILLNNGMKDPVNTSGGAGVYSWTFNWITGNTQTSTNYLQYPYYSHNNDPYNPTDDINWGEVPWEYHAEQETITDNNLYNKYWKNYITQIATGRLVTSRFYLTEVDINKVKNALNTRIFVDGTYYYINKIVDFDPTRQGETTEVQLLKINNPVVFTPTVSTGDTVFTPYEAMRLVQPPVIDNTNTILSKNVIVGGSNNFVGPNSDGAVIIGDDNIIGENFRGIVIGTGITATEGGIYLENAYIDNNGTVYNTSGETISNNFCDSGITTSVITSCDGGNMTIGGGIGFSGNEYSNVNTGDYSSIILGGFANVNSGQYGATVVGGHYNTAAGNYGTSVFGGINNTASAYSSVVVGGNGNTATSNQSAVVGGFNNNVTGTTSAIVGGQLNIISNVYSFIGGGTENLASGTRSAIIGGIQNTASGLRSSVVGGGQNTASGQYSSVLGGNGNSASGDRSAVLGGYNNNVTGTTSTIVGGKLNINASYSSSIIGGANNTHNNTNLLFAGYSSIIGGNNNTTDDVKQSSIIGGQFNSITTFGADNASIIGGQANVVSGYNSAVIGGGYNNAVGPYSTIVGGSNNSTSGITSAVLGGNSNVASGTNSAIVGGKDNSATTFNSVVIGGGYGVGIGNYGNTASGTNSAIIGGANNTASGSSSVIIGGGNNTTNGSLSAIIGGQNNIISGQRSVVLGGIGITGTTNDTVYVPNLNIQTDKGISFGSGNTMVMVEIPINDWNMDSTSFVTINTGLGLSSGQTKSIRQVSVIIRDDTDSSYKSLDYADSVNTTPNGYWEIMTTDQIYLERRISGGFDSTSYDSTSYNRGFITFWYNPNA